MAETTTENLDVVAQHMFDCDYNQIGCVFKKCDVYGYVKDHSQKQIDKLKDGGETE